MKAPALVGSGAVAVAAAIVLAGGPLARAGDDKLAAGKQAFVEVARVLQSPRCRNCHPAGDRPLQGDQGQPHAQNISRASVAAGLPCSACHQDRNSEAIGVAGGPPGAPRWGLPPAEHPMVFQGKTAAALCAQLKDPAQNGGKSLAQLLEHVTHDPLVLWAWSPGGKRPHAAAAARPVRRGVRGVGRLRRRVPVAHAGVGRPARSPRRGAAGFHRPGA